MEAIHIRREPCDILMNGKGEWGLNIIPQQAPTPDGDIVDFTEQRERNSRLRANFGKTQETPEGDEFDQQYTHRRKRQRLKENEGEGQGSIAAGQDKPRDAPTARSTNSNTKFAYDRMEAKHTAKTSLKRKAT